MPHRGGVNERKPGWAKGSNPDRTRGCRNGGKHSRSFWQRRPSRGDERRGSRAVDSVGRGSLQPPTRFDGDNECSSAFEEGSSRSREPFARGVSTRRHAQRIVQRRRWAKRGAREGQLSRQSATARSEWSGTRSLLEASGASNERSPKGDGLRHGIAKAVPVRARIEGSRLCPRVVEVCCRSRWTMP